MASTKKTTLSMKLLVDSKAQQVLYAEAGKDVVDFLFSLLTLPVGTVVKLLTADSMVGSFGNLYGSVAKLDSTYICNGDAKNVLLTPAGGYDSGKLLELPAGSSEPEGAIFRCDSSIRSYPDCRNYVTKVSGTACWGCNTAMATRSVIIEPADSAALARAVGAGFVQGIVTYTVMDDLKVAPMSSISGITLLNAFGVTDIGSLQEKTVELGYTEGLEILKGLVAVKDGSH